jgi:hypothetical protein
MDRDTFIITGLLPRCRALRTPHHSVQIATRRLSTSIDRPGSITMEICGEFFKLHKDCDLFAYFHHHYSHFFPQLTNRTRFVRQAAGLWQLKAAIQKRLVEVSQKLKHQFNPLILYPC